MDFLVGFFDYCNEIFGMACSVFSGWPDTPMAIIEQFGQEKH